MSGHPPLALYVHFPWCARKCPYCDFNSHTSREALPEEAYVSALIADLDRELRAVADRELVSVFIGGGTPSLIDPVQIARLLTAVRARLPLAADAEVTMEANPDSAERDRFGALREAGVNRLSVGVQSFHDPSLRALGRLHDGTDAVAAVRAARAAGFGRINVDLMYGLPGQTTELAAADVAQACALEPGHVSRYQLTLEPGTPFHRQPPVLPDEEAAWRIERAGETLLARAGYGQYEVSAWAKPGHRCRHNLNYWLYGDYLGIGAGAHGKVTGTDGRIRRTARVRGPRAYLAAVGAGDPVGERWPDEAETRFEFMLNVLRLPRGFPVSLYAERTGGSRADLEAAAAGALARGLLERSGDWWRPTARGRRFLNDLQGAFLPGREAGRTAATR